MSRFVSNAFGLVDPRGRTDRRGLLVVAVILIGVEAVLFGLGLALQVSFDSWLVFPVKALLAWLAVAATSKRLHDLGLSALWMIGGLAAIFAWAMVVVLSILFTAGHETLHPGGAGFIAAYAATMIPAFSAALWLHLAPGHAHANRFGPPPSAVFPPWREPRPEAALAIAPRS